MAKIWANDTAYTIGRIYVDAMVRKCFSSIRVEGLENIPAEGSVLIAPNHCNTLMDALVVLQSRKKPTAFGARADIFRKPKAAAALRWLRILPLARKRDNEQMRHRNPEIFREVVDAINHDVPFTIFVEGTHHVGYTVHPANIGIFKIANLSLEEHPEKTTWIIPAGISYSDFYHLRHSVTLRYGKPIDAASLSEMTPGDKMEMLTGKIQELVIEPEHRKSNLLLKVISAPVFALAAIASLPVWAISEILVGKMKDKAWSNTVRYVVQVVMLPVLTLIAAPLLFVFLPWYWALAGILWLWIAPDVFYQLLTF